MCRTSTGTNSGSIGSLLDPVGGIGECGGNRVQGWEEWEGREEGLVV